VSGGVDSMVLLDMLRQQPGLELTVAHFEHGIREDSDFDRMLVKKAAQRYGLPFVFERGNLGPHASEAQARDARYAFLRHVKEQTGAQAIITAHHQDDLIETAIINLLRGTGRRGLSSLRSTPELVRPLLDISKHALYGYAAKHPELVWRVDSTNQSDAYLRNYIRHHLTKRLGEASKELLLSYIEYAGESNPLIDSLLLHDINRNTREGALDRQWFIMLPYDVSCETMAAWLRAHNVRGFDRKAIERLVVSAKVARPGVTADVDAEHVLKISKATLEFLPRSTS
ncbi:MAG: tRNA lysidine(34) synthetase TilS, partial [Patescibacteria group bacterium]